MNVSDAKLLFLSNNLWGQLLLASPNKSSQVFLCAFEGQKHRPRCREKKKVMLPATQGTFEVHFRVCHLKNAAHCEREPQPRCCSLKDKS